MTARPKLRVLVVEDDAAVRKTITAHLRKQGYDVAAAASAEAVLDSLRARTLDYDVALTDVHLPGLSGLDLSRLLLATSPLRPLILITGDDDETIARTALAHGATGYLLKPFELFELDAVLGQAVSMLQLVEATEALARAQSNHLEEWGEAGGMLPRSWLHLGDERSGAGAGHGGRVVSIAGLVARALGERLDARDRDVLRTAARTHEIGRLLGSAAPAEVARRTAQLLTNLGFDDAVPELVRDSTAPWSPGIPLAARVLSLADWVDHEAVRRAEQGLEPEVAIAAALDAAREEAGEMLDPELVEILVRGREQFESMWVLQRQGQDQGQAA